VTDQCRRRRTIFRGTPPSAAFGCVGLFSRAPHIVLLVALVVAFGGCSSKVMKSQGSQEILKNDEFDKQFKVQDMPLETAVSQSGLFVLIPGPEPIPSAWSRAKTKKEKSKPIPVTAKHKPAKGDLPVAAPAELPVASADPLVHEPAVEDAEGFEGRRPKVDPYRVGEKVTLDMSYFGVSAGDMTLEVRPFVFVNGKKAYHFAGTAISTSVFAMFYAVDDWFESFMDYATLVPTSYSLHVKESKQLRETRCLFDWNKSLATFWDKKINSEDKVEERKFEWEIAKYSQNIFTAAYYLRNFQLRVGKSVKFRVAHEKENFDVTGEVLRQETITTALGEMKTVVIKPTIHLNGQFRPVGDIFFWMTDDDRKFIVRIESKIKIGTIVASLKALDPGH
jgi:hypothetical protein